MLTALALVWRRSLLLSSGLVRFGTLWEAQRVHRQMIFWLWEQLLFVTAGRTKCYSILPPTHASIMLGNCRVKALHHNTRMLHPHCDISTWMNSCAWNHDASAWRWWVLPAAEQRWPPEWWRGRGLKAEFEDFRRFSGEWTHPLLSGRNRPALQRCPACPELTQTGRGKQRWLLLPSPARVLRRTPITIQAAAVQTLLPAVVAVVVAVTTSVNEGLAGVGVWLVVEHGEGGAAGTSVWLLHTVLCRQSSSAEGDQVLKATFMLAPLLAYLPGLQQHQLSYWLEGR